MWVWNIGCCACPVTWCVGERGWLASRRLTIDRRNQFRLNWSERTPVRTRIPGVRAGRIDHLRTVRSQTINWEDGMRWPKRRERPLVRLQIPAVQTGRNDRHSQTINWDEQNRTNKKTARPPGMGRTDDRRSQTSNREKRNMKNKKTLFIDFVYCKVVMSILFVLSL